MSFFSVPFWQLHLFIFIKRVYISSLDIAFYACARRSRLAGGIMFSTWLLVRYQTCQHDILRKKTILMQIRTLFLAIVSS